jgi:transcriptional regulator with XRE-family HTH domain
MTQQQVASRCFIERSYYSQIERGKRNPSTDVAKNIAFVLEFNPLKFYKKDLNLSFFDNTEYSNILSYPYVIESYFNSSDRGKVVYLYDDINAYYQHFITYLLAGIHKKRHCIIIDHQINPNLLSDLMKRNCTEDDINRYLHIFSINRNECTTMDKLSLSILNDLKTSLNESDSIHIWVHQENICMNDFLSTLQNEYDFHMKILYVHAYDASSITASEYTKMMKQFPLLMTDGEIVNSPFYRSFDNPQGLPSIYMQENI